MAKYIVYRDGTTIHGVPDHIKADHWNNCRIIGEFEADCSCDYLNTMLDFNIKAGRIDKFWNRLEKKISKEGI